MNKFAKWTISGAMALSLVAPITFQPSTTASAFVWKDTGEAAPIGKFATVYSSTSMKKKLGTIKLGTSFMTTYVGKKWTKLKHKGQTGYILSKELTYYSERANPYDSAVTISKRLTKKINALKAAEAEGDIQKIVEKLYPTLEKSVKDMKEELSRDGLTKSQIAKFKKESYNPAEKQANRMKKIVQAWDLYTKAAYNMIDFKYTEAREQVDLANKLVNESKKVNTYNKKFTAAVNKKMKDMERRFSYSTFDELAYDFSDPKMIQLTGKEKDVFNKKHSNGIKSTKYTSYTHIFNFNNGNYFNKEDDSKRFKKLTFTMTAGEYWKNKKQDVENLAEVFVNGTVNSKMYVLDSTKKSVKVTVDLTKIHTGRATVIYLIGSLDRDVIISDIGVYR